MPARFLAKLLPSPMRGRKPLTAAGLVLAVSAGTVGLVAAPALATACAPSSGIAAGYQVLTFSDSSSCTWTVPAGVTSAEVLVVAGGGGGSSVVGTGLLSSSGGGAGGLIDQTGYALSPGSSVAVTVGAGGAASLGSSLSLGNGGDGSGSVFGTLSTTGGGGGGTVGSAGDSGGSGGGGGYNLLTGYAGGSGVSGQGYAGGTASAGVTGGGGGGAGGAASGGTPGVGRSVSITGSAVTYAAGGSPSGVADGSVGGGGASSDSSVAMASSGNTGTVIVRYAVSVPVFGPTAPPSGTVASSYPGYSFAASGTPTPTYTLSSGALPPGLTLSSTGVLSGTPTTAGTYTFKVTATNAAGSVTTTLNTLVISSPARTSTPTPTPTPTPTRTPTPTPTATGPATPTAVAASAGTSSINVSWTPTSDATSYTAYASPGPATCDTTATSCVLGATAGMTYTVTVVAHTSSGDSLSSAPSNSVTPTAPPVPASAPTAAPTTLTTDQGQIGVASPGQNITVIGTGFAAYSTAKVLIYSSPVVLATVTTDSTGSFSAPVSVPSDLATGDHNFVATGVDDSGVTHQLRLPISVASVATAPTVPTVPSGGQIQLLDANGNPASTVTVTQGTYSLDSHGTIVFTPVSGFWGKADPVKYTMTDSLGHVITGTYAAVVPDPTGVAGVPLPTSRRVISSVGRKAAATVPCTLTVGVISQCVVTATAKVGAKTVTVGRGTFTARATQQLHQVSVRVPLTKQGRSLVARPGGAAIRLIAVVHQRSLKRTKTVLRAATVLARTYTLAHTVTFTAGSAKLKAAEATYLARVRKRLAGARTITCTAYAAVRGTTTSRHAEALSRARAACAPLTKGLKVNKHLVAIAVAHVKKETAAKYRRVVVTVTN